MIKTLGLVIAKQHLGESDRIVTILSPSLGKRRLVAKAVRRPLSKLAGHLDTWMVSQLMITERGSLSTVTAAESVEVFNDLRKDLKKIDRASKVIKLARLVAIEDAPQQALFQNTVDALVRIDQDEPWANLWLTFLSRLSRELGLWSDLDRCNSCRCFLNSDDFFWNETDRQYLCLNCQTNKGGVRLDKLTFKLMKILRHRSYETVRRVNLPPQTAAAVERLLLKNLEEYYREDWRKYAGLA